MSETVQQLKQDLAAGTAVLLDVREEQEWEAGHIKGAQHIALSELEAGAEPQLDGTKRVYLYCRSGNRVRRARPLIEALGCDDVVDLREGFQELVQVHGFEQEL